MAKENKERPRRSSPVGLFLCPERSACVWAIVKLAIWNSCGTSSSISWANYYGGGKTMPKKPKRPCSHPGCPRLTDGRFCEEHAKAEAQRYEKYDRDPAVRRRYGRAWKRIRDSYVQQHPLCERCQEQGKLIPTEEVHHKVPLSEGGTHARSNLIALCKSCHAQIHAERGDRWHNH